MDRVRECSKSYEHRSEEYIAIHRGGRIVYSDYELVTMKCCRGHTFSMIPTQLQRGEWCSYCGISAGEEEVKGVLEEIGVEYYRELAFPKSLVYVMPLRFDYYLPQYRLAIEYDGRGHYYEVTVGGLVRRRRLYDALKRDQIKNEWCKHTGRNLLRIPFWRLDRIQWMVLAAIQRCKKGERVLMDEAEQWRIKCIELLGKNQPPIPPPIPASSN